MNCDYRNDADRDLAAYCGRFINRARAEAGASTVPPEPVEIDPLMAATVAAIIYRLRKPVSEVT